MSASLTFWSELLRGLFSAQERVLVHEIDLFSSHRGPNTRRSQHLLLKEAVEFVRQRESTPNIYFSPGVFEDGNRTYATACRRVRGLGFDIDFGTVGHHRPSVFATAKDAQLYIRSLPLQPSATWMTGHGIQGFYLFKSPLELAVGATNQTTPLDLYRVAAGALRAVLQADVTCGPERPFRIPGTLNRKPNCPDVRGRVLGFATGPAYDWDELLAWLHSHALAERGGHAEQEGGGGRIREDDLPAYILEELQTAYVEGERSSAFHCQVGSLYFRGFDRSSVEDIMAQFSVVGADKYDDRLRAEAKRSFESWVRYRPNVQSRRALNHPLVFLERRPQYTPLADCRPLTPAFEQMLQDYARLIAGRELPSGTLMAARFLEHVYDWGAKFISNLPCGSGKSTWSICHLAVHAGPAQKYVYVTRTLADLFNAARDLNRLAPALQVGRYHGFDAEECQRLCGRTHTWIECSSNNRRRVCRTCRAKAECSYFTRRHQLKRDVVIMAHAGFLTLLADPEGNHFADRSLIIDEDPQVFRELTLSGEDLEAAEAYISWQCAREYETGASLTPLLPGSTFALDLGHRRTAEHVYDRHYYANHSMPASVYKKLAPGLARCVWHPEYWRLPRYWKVMALAPPERSREVISSLLQFFRPAAFHDLEFVLHERVVRTRDQQSLEYTLRRPQGLDPQSVNCRRLVIHNGSAQLSKQPHNEVMPIFGCPDIDRRGSLVTLHVVQANPRRSRTPANTEAMLEILRQPGFARHENILLAVPSSLPEEQRGRLQEAVRGIWPGTQKQIQVVGRGELRGSNAFAGCTLVLLASSAFSTPVDDLVLTEALRTHRSIPVEDVFTNDGEGPPEMSRGRFSSAALQELYMQQALDEQYQAFFRGKVRTGEPVEVVLAMPSATWPRVFWLTVLPGFHLGGAYHWNEEERTLQPYQRMLGFVELLRMPTGFEIGKREAGQRLGYNGNAAWSDNRGTLLSLLDPFYEEANVRTLRRTAAHPCPSPA